MLLPKFEIPNDFIVKQEFKNNVKENAYLRFLTLEGAKKGMVKLMMRLKKD